MFEDLNTQQRAAVEYDGEALLIVAGAGTGKTKTLAARVCRLIEDGAAPHRILLLTFTRRAASEMVGRVSAVSNNRSASDVWGGTFHAIGNRLLRQYGSAAGLPASFTVLDQGDSTDLFGLVRNDGDTKRPKRFPRPETIAGIYGRMVNSAAKLDDVLEVDYPWCAEHRDELKEIFTGYTAKKRANQVLDYDDLLLFWRGLLTSSAGDPMRQLFDHILVDEYQDTNPIQSDIIRTMVGPNTSVCAVGDDAQAIYGFRSATVENMWAFADHFPGAETVALEQNYRSTMPILEVANKVLAQSLPGESKPRHYDKALWSDRTQGPRPKLVTAKDESDQSRHLADAILESRERGFDLRDQAVLFRAGHHSDNLELELTRRDIPYLKYGGLKYLEAAHVKDLLALLRVLDNQADELAWHRVLASIDGVGPATMRRFSAELGLSEASAADANDGPLARLLAGTGAAPNQGQGQFEELRAALRDCHETGLPPAEQVDRLKKFCELVFPNNYENPAARLADIEQLAATAGGYNSRSRFLTELTLDPPSKTSDRAGPPHKDDDWLTLSTVHSAKGMEWRSVYLMHASDGNLPSDMALGDADGMAEELRLMYVALTRAKDELTVSYPLRYHVNRFATDDRHVYSQPSRFLDPVQELVDEVTTEAGRADAVVDLTDVGVADEVDTLLHSLWE